MKLNTPPRLFLLLAWVFGTIFALVTPPFQVPDEFDHYCRAYQVSQGRLISVRRGGEIGGELPRSLLEFARAVSEGIPGHPDHKQSLARLWGTRKIAMVPEDVEFMRFGDVSWHAPMNYLAQAAGIAFARLVGAGPLMILYAGRLSNLFVWSVLIYFALRLIPVMDWTLLLLALMPMSLAQAASLSADATVNGVCFLFMAYVLRLAVGDSRAIGKGRLIRLCALGAAVALAKTAYVPLTMLFLMIPAARFGGGRRYWRSFAIFLLVCGVTVIGWSLCTYGAATYVAAGISPHEQAIYILHHPLRVLGLEIGRLFKITLLASIVGRLGWFDTRLFLPCVGAYAVVLIWMTLRSGRPGVGVSLGQKGLAAAAAAGCCVAVFTLIYLVFSRVGGSSIEAVQGRYLIPVTPLVFLILYPGPGAVRPSPWKWVGGFSCAFLMYTTGVLICRYYVA